MSFVAIAAVVGAGATAYGAYSSAQARSEAEDNAKKLYGSKPQVAPYIPIDLAQEQGKATTANLANADSIMAMLEKYLPGFGSLVKEGLGNSLSLERGEIPQDVQDAVTRSSAFQALSGGYGGTQMGSANTARNLGLTSLDLLQMGQNSAQKWEQMAKDTYEPFLITTKDETAAAAANNAGQQATQQAQYNVAAAPDPAAVGSFNLGLSTSQAIPSYLTQFTSMLSNLYRSQQLNQTQDTILPSGSGYFYNPATGQYQTGGG